MPEGRLARAALATLQAAAAWACALAFDWRALLLLAPVAALSLRFELPSLRPGLARLLSRLVLGLAGLTSALGLAWVLYLPVADTLVPRLPPATGTSLAVLGTLLLFAQRSVPPARGALAASLGALLASSFVNAARLQAPFGLAGLAGFVLLAAGAPPRRRLVRLSLAGALALGVVAGLWRLLPWAQPFVEAAVADATNPGSSGVTGFGASSSLGDVQALSRSTRPLLRLFAPRPARLRAQVWTRFDGRSWSGPRGAGRALEPLVGLLASAALREWEASLPGRLRAVPGTTPDALGAPDALAGSVLPIVAGPPLFVPSGLLAIKSDAAGLSSGAGGTLVGRDLPALYGFVARPETATQEACGEACLALPDRLDPRWRVLAEELRQGAAAPRERVRRTLRHLDDCCLYSLEPGRFRTNDPLAEFLFDKRRGYCEYFASSAALLLRLQGLPTRYVKGLQVSEDQRAGEHFLVRESEAHAWIDVLLPEGWVEVDPTPADDYAAVHAQGQPGWLARAWEALSARAARLWAGLSAFDPAWLGADLGALLAPLVLVALAALAVTWWRRRRHGPRPRHAPAAPLRPELLALVRRFDQACARVGAPRPAARGLLEHLERLPATAGSPAWRDAAREAAQAIYAETYGGRPLVDERLRALRERL